MYQCIHIWLHKELFRRGWINYRELEKSFKESNRSYNRTAWRDFLVWIVLKWPPRSIHRVINTHIFLPFVLEMLNVPLQFHFSGVYIKLNYYPILVYLSLSPKFSCIKSYELYYEWHLCNFLSWAKVINQRRLQKIDTLTWARQNDPIVVDDVIVIIFMKWAALSLTFVNVQILIPSVIQFSVISR